MSIAEQVEAWRTELAAILDGKRDLHTWSEAQDARAAGTLGDRYVLFDVSHRVGAPRHAQGRTPMRGWRLSLLIVGTEYERDYARGLLDALTDRRVAALSSTPVTHETDDETDDKDLSSQWTYATPA